MGQETVKVDLDKYLKLMAYKELYEGVESSKSVVVINEMNNGHGLQE